MRNQNKVAKSNWSLLRAAVHEVLIEQWDPIGINDVAAAGDEYDEYISAVIGLLNAGASVPDLTNYLLGIEVERIGMPGDNTRAERAAHALVALRRADRRP